MYLEVCKMNAESLVQAVRQELQKHSFDTFDDPSEIGNRALLVTGCPVCRKRMQTVNQFVSHILDDVIPETIRKAFG